MRNKFLQSAISAFMLITTASVSAQSWLLTGNSGLNASKNFIGTTDSKALIFRTNNLERLRINSNGSIGMGVATTTLAKLVTDGTVGNTMAVFGNSLHGITLMNDLPTIGFNCYYNGGWKALNSGYGGTVFVNNSSGDMSFSTGTSGAAQGASIGQTVRMTITKDGQVGIGTTEPNALLDVNVSNYGPAIYASSTNSYGVSASSEDGVGVYATSTNQTGVSGYSVASSGVYAYSENSNALYAYNNSYNTYAAYLDGDVYSTGNYVGSDKKLKQNINDFSSALDIINRLQPKYYEYRHDGNYKLMNLPQGGHYGLIAQDVEKLLPGLIKNATFKTAYAKPKPTADNIKNSETIDFKTLNYTELIPLLIKGVQEQQQQINNLKQTVQILSANQSPAIKSALPDNNSTAYQLQNSPNPFSQNTIIKCYVPAAVKQAQLVLYSADGRLLKSYSIKNGMNETTINGGTLSAGEYICSLIIDGAKMDSKYITLAK